MSRASSFLETNDSEVRSALALQDCHRAIILYLRLKMTIRRRLLPKSINLRLSRFFNHLRETRRFHFKEFHSLSTSGGFFEFTEDSSGRTLLESPPENYGKEDQTTVAAFLPWRDS